MTSYAKPYKPIPEQIALLQSRGMQIADVATASAELERIGYYRLSAYWFPFRESQPGPPGPDGKPTTVYLDTYRSGASFSDAIAMYVFDKKLRLLVMDAADRIEVALRVDVALLLSQRDPWAHRDPNQMHSRFATADPPMCHSVAGLGVAERPNLIALHVLGLDVRNELVVQIEAGLARVHEQLGNRVDADVRHARDRAHAHALVEEVQDLNAFRDGQHVRHAYFILNFMLTVNY